ASTRLGRIAARSLASASEDQSGFRLLPGGSQAIEARVALARRAQRSIDAEYYLLASDSTGLQLLRELAAAAQRGVHVRLLVDDLYAAGQDRLFADLASRDRVEVRVFNPLPARNGGFKTRIAWSLHELDRINHRLHAKLFVADNSVAILGGRNIADEYFERGSVANFIDLDVLAAGPVVRSLSAGFDAFWNDRSAYPIQFLSHPSGDGARAWDRPGEALAVEPDPADVDELGQSRVGSQLEAGRLDLHLAEASAVSDAPAKLSSRSAGRRSEVAEAYLELVRSAQAEIFVVSPYVVPCDAAMTALRELHGRGVQVNILTNSLASTDEPLVHLRYARYRTALLNLGFALHEVMPTSTVDRKHADAGTRPTDRLHAKFAVADRERVYIGSMNLDRRSALMNAEIGVVIRSADLAAQVLLLLARDRLPNTYTLRTRGDGPGVEWLRTGGDVSQAALVQPERAGSLPVRIRLFGLLVAEDML
ncbi:MAG: phospholipase D-like domain-containing protein, partial [Rhizobacter sp.]